MVFLIIVYEFVDKNIVWVKEKLRNVNKFEINHYEQKYDPKEYFENNVKVERKNDEDGNKEEDGNKKDKNQDKQKNAENAENNKTENKEEQQIEREIVENDVYEPHPENEISEIPEVQDIQEIQNISFGGSFLHINRKHEIDSDYKRYIKKKEEEERREKEMFVMQNSVIISRTGKTLSYSNNKFIPKNVGAGGGNKTLNQQRNSLKSVTNVRRVNFSSDNDLLRIFSPQNDRKETHFRPFPRKSLFQTKSKQDDWDKTSNKSEEKNEDELVKPTKSKLLKKANTLLLQDIKSINEILPKSPIMQNYLFKGIQLENKKPPKKYTKKLSPSFEFYKTPPKEFNFTDKKIEELKLNQDEGSSKNLSFVSLSDSFSSKKMSGVSVEYELNRSNNSHDVDKSISERMIGISGLEQELAKQNGKYCFLLLH